MRRFLFSILILQLAATGAMAQGSAKDSLIKGSSTIEVIQSYKPEVKQAPKPELIPSLPPADTTRPVFNYEVPQQALYYTYSSLPLRPLALGRDTAKLPFENYVKLGAGNLSTFYLDAGIGSIHGKDYETAIHLHDLTQQGNIQYQQSSLTGLEAEGTLHHGDNTWHAMIDGERNEYYYYGYDHNLYQFDRDSVKQTYMLMRAGVDLNHSSAMSDFSYHPAVSASLYTDRFNATEATTKIDAPLYYHIDTGLQLQLALDGTFTQFKNNTYSNSNNIVELVPGIDYHTKAFSGHAYLAPAIGQGGNFYFLPDIGAGYKIPNSLFTINAGWQATLRQNSFEQLSMENPYMSDVYNIMQTRSDEVYGNIQGNVGDHITFSARVSWWDFSNLPLFINDSGDQKAFRVVYDTKLNATSFQGMVRYQVANTFGAGISGTFYSFSNGTYSHPWGVPGINVKGDLLFRPITKLTITAYLAVLDNMYALDINDNAVKLKPVLDIGGNVEYNIIPRLSAFVQITNLLNDKYQRWLGYETYGMNIYGGLRLKF